VESISYAFVVECWFNGFLFTGQRVLRLPDIFSADIKTIPVYELNIIAFAIVLYI